MDLDRLSGADKAIVGEALRAAADGPFFPEWEFHTLFGLTRSEVRAIADSWPKVDLASANVGVAVSNALNNLLGYPHHQESEWSRWISVQPPQLDDLLSRIQGPGDRTYFERLR